MIYVSLEGKDVWVTPFNIEVEELENAHLFHVHMVPNCRLQPLIMTNSFHHSYRSYTLIMLRDDLVHWILIYFLQSETKSSWDLGAVLDFEHPGFHKAQKRAMVTKKRRRRGAASVSCHGRGRTSTSTHATGSTQRHRRCIIASALRRRRSLRLWKR